MGVSLSAMCCFTRPTHGSLPFRYMRGAYSWEELHGLDGFATMFGIQLIPHIQTLGHMEQILQWPAYGNLKDTKSILLAGFEESYTLLRKVLNTIKSTFSSGIVHIGMVILPPG